MDNRLPAGFQDGLAYADQWLDYRREFRNIPGLVVAVRHSGELLLSRAYGFAQLEDAVPMSPSHIFRVASHSKTFTATAIMQLVEQGRLRLDDPASATLPWLGSDSTIRELLNHTSGLIRDGRDADFWQIHAEFPDRDELISIASESPILDRNSAFKYSNIGYGVLGLVIEAVTGTSYNQYVTENIVDRLGLADTGPEVDPSRSDRLVTGYSRSRLGVPRQAYPHIVDTRALSAATGFYSTAEDLSAYASAHCFGDERLLTDSSKRQMQHPNWDIEYADEGYGLGFSVHTVGKRNMVGHAGGFPGQSTRTLFDPGYGLVVVVLSNTNASDGLAGWLAETVVRIIDFAMECAFHANVDPGVPLEQFTGRFANTGGVTDIVAFGNALKAVSPELDNPVIQVSDLEVVDADTLRIAHTGGYGPPGETVTYRRDANGSIASVRIGGVTSYPVDVFRERSARGIR